MQQIKTKQRTKLSVNNEVCLEVNAEEAKGAAGVIFDQVTAAYTAGASGRAV